MLAGMLLMAYLLDRLVGDPAVRLHPVRLLGDLAAGLERRLYQQGRRGLWTGTLCAATTLGLVLSGYLGLRLPLLRSPPPFAGPLGVALDTLTFAACFAFRSLFDHVRPVLRSLEQENLTATREAVQRIVGRDAHRLDRAGATRATIESVAESLNDGAMGPLFYFTAAGATMVLLGASFEGAGLAAACGALGFRTANTLDSMFGYRNERYLDFGWASARLDDLLGLVPARLTVLLLVPAATSLRLDAPSGLATWRRDRRRHASPNAGQSESFVAGALGLRLGGPTTYAHGTVEKSWLGDGATTAEPRHLRQACRLVFRAGTLGLLCAAALLTTIGAVAT